MDAYLRSFALADNMELHAEEGVEWICPKPDAKGPSLVFKVFLDESTADSRIDKLVTGIKMGSIPEMWFISPNFKPENVEDILRSKGFEGLTSQESGEKAMAMDMGMVAQWPETNPSVEVKKVQSLSEFGLWCDIVNEVLHGWPMVTPEHYHPWLRHDEIALYLAFQDGKPVATSAAIQYGDKATLEFIATLKEHRGHGAATAACVKALQKLQNRDVGTVTLRAFPDGAPLYAKLGFKSYYNTVALTYIKD